jgi:hypothetical protein
LRDPQFTPFRLEATLQVNTEPLDDWLEDLRTIHRLNWRSQMMMSKADNCPQCPPHQRRRQLDGDRGLRRTVPNCWVYALWVSPLSPFSGVYPATEIQVERKRAILPRTRAHLDTLKTSRAVEFAINAALARLVRDVSFLDSLRTRNEIADYNRKLASVFVLP